MLIFKIFLKKSYLYLIILTISDIYANQIMEVTVGVGEWPPYISKSLPQHGTLAQQVSQSFAAVGIKVIYRWLPWKRVFHMIKTGEIDATPGWSKNVERAKYSLFSESIVLRQYAHLFHKKDNPIQWKNLKDLIAYRFVGFIGYNYDYLVAEGIKIYYVKNEKQALNMILSNRADVFEANLIVGQKAIDQYLTSEQKSLITISDQPVKQFNYYVLFPQRARGEQIRRLFDEGFKLTNTSTPQ
ncbi:substrate-binding periplasmic protein [Zooshikella harenae]|uniref:Transporter substrate-binding domain-containing protein n=1 Tax=Zooshikella harenae TaxID=2827238 RepID=A0ABS5Z6F1_9GAMM|nr:transporter substrate-binding domain-containing protein [Zooshikella harenae]MBU2709626.1 transporter substrate-binding domain-containing protein [Zooshikella harenae]